MNSRVAALDYLRGLSVLGILLVNAIAFAQPMVVYDHPHPLSMIAADRSAWTVIEIFFRDKFITAFTLLFGVSTFLVGSDPTVLRRRLLWLMLFGIIHGALIWQGDILLLYAVCGLVFARWRHMPARRLLAMGLVVFVVGAVTVGWPQGEGSPVDPDLVARMRSGFVGSLAVNATQWARDILPTIVAYLPVTLGGMMIGLGLFHTGFLKGEASTRLYVLSIIGAVLGLGVIALAVACGSPWEPMLNSLLCLPVMLGYASGLILMARSARGRRLLYPLACAGRMAFTNYLCQSLIMTMIFYGGRGLGFSGLGLFGTMGYAALVPIVVTIWIAQLIVSALWLRRFRYGPFEWVWRSLSYGRRVAISKAEAL
jgi:uncharacterized protein